MRSRAPRRTCVAYRSPRLRRPSACSLPWKRFAMSERSVVAWVDALADALASHGEAVLALVAVSRGSTPRDAGVAMVVTPSDARGTIGGGHHEYETMPIARGLL